MSLLRKSLYFEPKLKVRGPGMAFGGVPIGATQSHAMGSLLIDMQIEGHPGFAKRIGKLKAVLDRYDRVFVSMPDEAGRSVLPDLEFVGKLMDQFIRRIGAEQV